MKGMRVQSIIRELRGEKIDIIEWSDEITTFAEKALQPAKVSRVSISDLTDKQLEVIVDDTQLSLAIGKKGQNVRLAAKLLGWKIDIKSEEEKRQEVEQQMQDLTGGPSTPIEQVSELGDGIIQKLVAAGITTVETLADMTPEQLEEIPGIGEKTLERISVAVRHYFGQFEEGEEGRVPQSTETDAAETGDAETESAASEAVEPAESETVEAGRAIAAEPGEAEIENAPAVVADAEAEAENAAVVLEEAESVQAAEVGTDTSSAIETTIENVPEAGETLELEENETDNTAESATTDEPAANEDGA
jgi:N utilization substance protein A